MDRFMNIRKRVKSIKDKFNRIKSKHQLYLRNNKSYMIKQ